MASKMDCQFWKAETNEQKRSYMSFSIKHQCNSKATELSTQELCTLPWSLLGPLMLFKP